MQINSRPSKPLQPSSQETVRGAKAAVALAGLLLVVFIAGCQSSAPSASDGKVPVAWTRLQSGMSRDQVHALLGPPDVSPPQLRLEDWYHRNADTVWILHVIYDQSGFVQNVARVPYPGVTQTGFQPRHPEPDFPAAAAEILRRQIGYYIDTNQVTGIPLLDPAVDWDDFRNWPFSFERRGSSYVLHVVQRQGDLVRPVPAPRFLQRDGTFFAYYEPEGKGTPAPTGPAAVWQQPGWIREKSFRAGGAEVFTLMLYPNGAPFLISRTEAGANVEAATVFSQDGSILGSQHGTRFTWLNQPVSAETFHQNRQAVMPKWP